MKALVVIPMNMVEYTFSAPLAWMFSKHKDKVKGVYSFELTRELVVAYDFFIVELNWFVQMYEFMLIVDYIKKTNCNARVLFGGLYSSLKYEEIFKRTSVDYYIQGDNEGPVNDLLEGRPIEDIPNFVGREFCNLISYVFKESDYKDLEFDLDWFPSYFKYYREKPAFFLEGENPNNTIYPLPMIITSKGGCTTRHNGCEHCMGSKLEVLKKIYNRPPIKMDNETLLHLLRKLEKKYKKATLFILSENNFDFTNQYFDIDMWVEIDANMPVDAIRTILRAFSRCTMSIGAYEEGVSGATVRNNYKQLLDAEDENHKVLFYIYNKDTRLLLDIPEDHRLTGEDTFPQWTHWDFYQNINLAIKFSKGFYSRLSDDKKLRPV